MDDLHTEFKIYNLTKGGRLYQIQIGSSICLIVDYTFLSFTLLPPSKKIDCGAKEVF